MLKYKMCLERATCPAAKKRKAWVGIAGIQPRL